MLPTLAEQADRLAAEIAVTDLAFADFTPALDVIVQRAVESLVVVGEPGAGKTALTTAYVQVMRQRRQPGGPVAVRFDLRTWTAGMSVRSWLVKQLYRDLQDYAAITAVVDAGLLHPVVDAVDELTPELRRLFLNEIAELPFPVLLTSRTAEPDDRLPVLELTPPPLHATLLRWPSVSAAVREDPAGPVATALADPVNLYLFKRMHSGKTSDPSALADREVFPDAASIGKHLLDDSDPEVQRDLQRLATLSRNTGADGIAWWRLADLVPPWVVRAPIVLVSVLLGLQYGDVFEAWQGTVPLPRWLPGMVIALAVGVVLLWVARPRPPVEIDWSLLGSRLTGIGFTGLTLVVVSIVLIPLTGRPFAVAIGVVGTVILWGWEWALTRKPTEGRMDDPPLVLRRDRVAALLRLGLYVSGLYATAGILMRPYTSEQGFTWLLLLLVIAVLSTSGSAYNRYRIAGWLPRSSHVRDAVHVCARNEWLVRREGGVYHLREEAVRRALDNPRFQGPGPRLRTRESATRQVSVLRHELAEEACRRAEVRGLVDEESYESLIGRVADDVSDNIGAIVASASASRSTYMRAKADYTRVLLRLRFHEAVIADDVLSPLGPSSWALTATGATYMLLQNYNLSIWQYVAVVALAVAVRGLQQGIERRRRLRRRVMKALWEFAAPTIRGVAYAGALQGVQLMIGSGTLVPWGLAASAVGFGLLGTVVYGMTAAWRAQVNKLWWDDPSEWPEQEGPRAERERAEAVKAHRAWIDALVERGVRPLVGPRLAAVAKRSYDTVLPEADVRRLGDVTDVAQYVSTESSRRLMRMMESMSRGAIGISGPRGAGKSTVLTMFGELGFGARPNDVTLVVPAPTGYASREFLIHLYAILCARVIGTGMKRSPYRRKWPWLLMSAVGSLTAVGVWHSTHVARAAAWIPQHWRPLMIGAGALAAAVPPLVLWAHSARARRRPEDEVIREARRRLDGLRYVETTTLTRAFTAKPPGVAEFGGSHARARADQVKTFPELVGEFRSFLSFLTSRKPGARVVVCVDELDKIASAAEAERFLNDIKAVFGVEGCFFLVAVSDDALASYSRRSLAVRTAFDSAFDTVVNVKRFELADTRRLLVQRVTQLPEPFVWLCHVLSGGLPRDLNRTVRELYDQVASSGRRDLASLTRGLVRSDLESVTDGLSTRLTDRFDGFAVRLRQHILNARRLEMTSTALSDHPPLVTQASAPDELLLVHEQFRSYLTYASTVLGAFCDRIDVVVAELEDTEAEQIEYLALARALLAVDPVAAVAYVADWQRAEELIPSMATHNGAAKHGR